MAGNNVWLPVGLPGAVERVKAEIQKAPNFKKVAKKKDSYLKLLSGESDNLKKMWLSLEREEKKLAKVNGSFVHDDWVWTFLRHCMNTIDLPPYHLMSSKERQVLSDKIASLSDKLAGILKKNKLDAHLVSNTGKMFNGFFVYEDFGESNQQRIDDMKLRKLKLSKSIEITSERAKKKIADEPLPKRNVDKDKNRTEAERSSYTKARRFIYYMYWRNMDRYGQHLSQVIATATNTIFDTVFKDGVGYRASHIKALCVPRKSKPNIKKTKSK